MTGPRTYLARFSIFILLVLGLLLHTTRVNAKGGGSVYSRFGIGDLSRTTSTELFGLGGTGLAVMPVGSVNDLNPASWASIHNIRFSAGALYEGFSTTDGNSSGYFARTRFDGFTLAIPLSSGEGITFASGLIPYSRINYLIVTPETRAGLDYTMTHQGDGGISEAFAGMSITLAPGLHAAARIEYLFGSLRYSMKQTFGTSANNGAGLVRSENIRGFGSMIGIIYEGPGSLSFGLTFSPATYPTAETERVYDYDATPSSSPPDSVSEGENTFKLPMSIGSGVSYRTPGLLLAMDVRYQDWAGTTFGTSPGTKLRNSVRISAGAEFFRDVDPNPITSRKVTYAVGVFHEGGYLEVGNTPIRESGISAGLSFPILLETRLSFAASFSMRGSTDNNLQDDKIFRVSASMEISELWFQRPVEE